MGILERLQSELGGLDLAAIGSRVGLSPEQVQTGAGALLPRVADADTDNTQATAEVAAQTGLPYGALAALIPAIVGHARALPGAANSGTLAQIEAGIPQADSQQGGIFARLAHAVDRDGDGNPLNDLQKLMGGA